MATATGVSVVRADEETGPKFVRMGFNVVFDVAEAFRTLCLKKAITTTEGLRRAIVLWKMVEDEMSAGRQVQIYDPKSDRTREVVFL